MINSSNYVEHVTKTESPVTEEMIARFSNPENIRLIHAGMGMVTESAEFIDMMKKHLFYGKPLDKINLTEECGDAHWYLALAVDILKTTMDEVMTTNIKKLQARYPEKFTEYHAENRNLENERNILEGKDCTTCDAQGVCGL